MRKKLFTLTFLLLSACGSGQHIYSWERPNTGGQWFARDHQECMYKADYWPWRWPGWPWEWSNLWFGYPELKLRMDRDASSGVWAKFTPYTGAMPVYVNSEMNDWSVSSGAYRRCMKKRGYTEKEPEILNRDVVR